MKKRPIILNIVIFSYVLLFIFRLFNPPYLFGKVVEGPIKYVSQAASLAILGVIIYGLYKMRFWGFIIFFIEAMLGLLNHLIVIVTFFVKPEMIPENLISANPTLNSILSIAYPFITIFWAGAAFYLLKKRKIFFEKSSKK